MSNLATPWTPRSCVHAISQARALEQVAIYFARGSSQPRDQTHISCTAGCHLHFHFGEIAHNREDQCRKSNQKLLQVPCQSSAYSHLIHTTTVRGWLSGLNLQMKNERICVSIPNFAEPVTAENSNPCASSSTILAFSCTPHCLTHEQLYLFPNCITVFFSVHGD